MRPGMRVIHVSGYIDRKVDLEAMGQGTAFCRSPTTLLIWLARHAKFWFPPLLYERSRVGGTVTNAVPQWGHVIYPGPR